MDKYSIDLPPKQTSVNIPLGLFVALSRIVLFNDDDENLWEYAKKGIDEKFDAMEKRALYSKFKNKNLSPDQREKARQDYLDRIGMNESFRWSAEKENYDNREGV